MDCSCVDHLVYGVPDLEAGVDEMASLLGVRPAPGGRHRGWGSANALLALGPSTYLEVIGPDPDGEGTVDGRPFGLDTLAEPGLLGWATAVTDLPSLVGRARGRGYDPGTVMSMSRRRPDGTELRWKLALPSRLDLREGGTIPFPIDWLGGETPAPGAPDGCFLTELHLGHPQPNRVTAALEALEIEASVEVAPEPRLRALLETPRGAVTLTSPSPGAPP